MRHPKPNITVKVDMANPGEFFACCGLLELTGRLWPGAEGWFDTANQRFCLCVDALPGLEASKELMRALTRARIENTMTTAQLQRRKMLASMSKKDRASQKLENEKKLLDKLWRESPIRIRSPAMSFRVDWFLDELSGGSTFKTWAGQQSVIDITAAMMSAIDSEFFEREPPDSWFSARSTSGSVPFNFDAMLGGQGSDLDVGFSRDPLQVTTATRPLVELLAFVGLQRSRPSACSKRNRYRYAIWSQAVPSEMAGAVASCCISSSESRQFEFSLLYRTKYLKSFLPATPAGAST